jgi:hypothetical protein
MAPDLPRAGRSGTKDTITGRERNATSHRALLIEVTQDSKGRLFGLSTLTPLREGVSPRVDRNAAGAVAGNQSSEKRA